MVDRDEPSVTAAAEELSRSGSGAAEPFVLDVTDREGLIGSAPVCPSWHASRLAHAAGISPTMADWRRIFVVDLVATATLAEGFDLWRPPERQACASRRWLRTSETRRRTRQPTPRSTRHSTRVARSHPRCRGPLDRGSRYRIWLGERASTGSSNRERYTRYEDPAFSVSPGLIDTRRASGGGEPSHHEATPGADTPRPHRSAEEVAAVVAFLLSDQAELRERDRRARRRRGDRRSAGRLLDEGGARCRRWHDRHRCRGAARRRGPSRHEVDECGASKLM